MDFDLIRRIRDKKKMKKHLMKQQKSNNFRAVPFFKFEKIK